MPFLLMNVDEFYSYNIVEGSNPQEPLKKNRLFQSAGTRTYSSSLYGVCGDPHPQENQKSKF
jgi:hypothetical protein